MPHSQPPTPYSHRPGLSLVELILFMGILALSSGAIIGFFLLSTDGRIRQQTATDVEQNVMQLQQFLANEVRHAERVIAPAAGHSGSVLTLQMTSSDGNPVIVAVLSGTMLLIRHDAEYALSPPEVTVSDFRAFNASATDGKVSLMLRYAVSRRIPLPNGGTYVREVEQGIAGFPHDAETGASCGCAAPRCDHGRYEWDICGAGVCSAMSGSILCPS